ncbi:MAG: hypothetical protein NTU61_01600, partial [Candidatus Altiarchaeota archaeon]|nr:hypothetical protein [Candidatus Altiarchaeota archaeon]
YSEGSIRPKENSDPRESRIWVPHPKAVVESLGDVETGRVWCAGKLSSTGNLVLWGPEHLNRAVDAAGDIVSNSYCRKISVKGNVEKNGRGFLYTYVLNYGGRLVLDLAGEGVSQVRKVPTDREFNIDRWRRLFEPYGPEQLPPNLPH